MALIPPQPSGALPGSGYWNDWIEKIRTVVNGLLTSITWSIITGTPTTLSGYGITDAQKGIQFKDEGGNLGTSGTVTSIDFTGAGVTASRATDAITVSIAGGATSVSQVATTITGVTYDTQYAEATVTDASITGTSKIIIGWGNITDADENTPDFDDVIFTAVPAAGSMTVRLTTTNFDQRLGGSYKINYLIG